jgi:hypothetical protein
MSEVKMTNIDEITPTSDIITSDGIQIATVKVGKERAAKRMIICTNALKDIKNPKKFFSEVSDIKNDRKNLRDIIAEVVIALENGRSISPTSIIGISLMMAHNEENAKKFIKNIPYETRSSKQQK